MCPLGSINVSQSFKTGSRAYEAEWLCMLRFMRVMVLLETGTGEYAYQCELETSISLVGKVTCVWIEDFVIIFQ
jgi:hypothetical protein